VTVTPSLRVYFATITNIDDDDSGDD